MSILTVDLGRFESGGPAARRGIVADVRKSLATGFVYARHGLAAETLDRAYELLATFFHLPRARKERWIVPGSQGQAGYTGTLVETAAGSRRPDWKEMLNWGRELTKGHPLRVRYPHRYMDRALPEADVPGITRALVALHDALFDLQRRFLRIIALGLGCDEVFFDEMLADGPTLTRAIRYPPMDEAPEEGHVWAGEHGDINLVTALPRATARGLQVKAGGQWIDAVAPEGCAILNTGLMLERLTNGAIPAGIHRVVADPAQRGERLSVVQFCHPVPWTVLAPLAPCVGPDRPQRFAPIEAGAWLDRVLYDINLVEDARRVK